MRFLLHIVSSGSLFPWPEQQYQQRSSSQQAKACYNTKTTCNKSSNIGQVQPQKVLQDSSQHALFQIVLESVCMPPP